MRLVESVGDLAGELQQLLDRKRTLLEARCQRLSFQVLHNQEVGGVLTAHIVERADIGMVERRNGFSFALKTLALRWVRRKMRRQDLIATERSRRVSVAR